MKEKQYRIKKESNGFETYYSVQIFKRFLFIKFWYTLTSYERCNIFPDDTYAKEYIKKHKQIRKTTIEIIYT